VRWTATLKARPQDVERLAAESVPDLSTADDDSHLVFRFSDPPDDGDFDSEIDAARAVIETFVRHVNGFGRLRWGRSFEGVAIDVVRAVDADGKTTQYAFIERGGAHLPHEQFAALVERLGYPRPSPPLGLEIVEALGGPLCWCWWSQTRRLIESSSLSNSCWRATTRSAGSPDTLPWRRSSMTLSLASWMGRLWVGGHVGS
jgi:hypothetical protein